MDNQRLAEVEKENVLLKLDLEWQKHREGMLIRGSEPTLVLVVMPIITALVVIAVLIGLAPPEPKLAAGCGCFLVAAGLVAAFGYARYATFEKARSAYLQRRAVAESARS